MKEFERVQATADIPRGALQRGVSAGAVGYILDVYDRPRLAYEVEFMEVGGRTIDVITCEPGEIAAAPEAPGALAVDRQPYAPAPVTPPPEAPAAATQPIHLTIVNHNNMPEQKPAQVHISQPITVQPAAPAGVTNVNEIRVEAPVPGPLAVNLDLDVHTQGGAKKVRLIRDADGVTRTAEITPTDPLPPS